jgi:hypothetical protein
VSHPVGSVAQNEKPTPARMTQGESYGRRISELSYDRL